MTGWVATWSGWRRAAWGDGSDAATSLAVFERIDPSHWQCTFGEQHVGVRRHRRPALPRNAVPSPRVDISASQLAVPPRAARGRPGGARRRGHRLPARGSMNLRRDLDDGHERQREAAEYEARGGQLRSCSNRLGLTDGAAIQRRRRTRRTSVRKAITRSITKISAVDAALSAHLEQHRPDRLHLSIRRLMGSSSVRDRGVRGVRRRN